MNIEKYYSFFDEYTKEYLKNASSEVDFINLNRKIEHSYRVVEFSLRIAKSLNLSEHDIFIVNVIALFHDLGRFEQFKKYGTYDDLISINHALMSIKVLDETKILSGMKLKDVNLIRKCIFVHNKAKLPNNLTEEERMFSNILRDADKLDAMKTMVEIIPELPKEKQKIFYTNKAESDRISDLVYNSILNKEVVLDAYITTKLDKQVRIMGFLTSDMNYKESFKVVLENNWLDKMYKMLPKQDRVTKIYNMIRKFLDKILE